MEHSDKLAMDAVKEAIAKLREAGTRPHKQNVPKEAERILVAKSGRRVTQSDAAKKVAQAIERLKDRKELKAPTTLHDWALIDRAPPKKEE
jgi:hypothetical protein